MDESGEFNLVLNRDCLLEIMKYVITGCELKKHWSKMLKYDDLINFVLAHEIFLDLLETYHKRLYEVLDLFLTCRITKLLIDLRVNKLSKRNEFFWISYLQSIREKDPFYVELHFKNNMHDKCLVYVSIKKKTAREQDFIVECVKFDVDVTAKDLYDICTRIPNLSNLEVEGTKIHGILADIGRHCKDLQVLAVHLSPEGGAAQYSSLVLLPNLKFFTISGVQESGSQLLFFDDLRKLHRPKSLPPLTLFITDHLSNKGRYITLPTFDSLHSFDIRKDDRSNDICVTAQFDLCETSEESNLIEESLVTIPLNKQTLIEFNRNKAKLMLNIHNESDIGQMGSLSKLPNLSRLTIYNKRNKFKDPKPLAKFLQSMIPKRSFALKYILINYISIDQLEAVELAKIESIRFLACHLSEWYSMKFLSQLINLQHLVINVRESINSHTSELLFDLLIACQVQATIACKDFTLRKNEKKVQIYKRPSYAEMNDVNTIETPDLPINETLNPLFQAFRHQQFEYDRRISYKWTDKYMF
ncbi:uncharacterized protein LOC128258438 [Drosophila gunungcola]|uniref:uncharacterized protein LOC128258438 n=1 Tax=Drosophila gunungcola TaxID=103775 RepID=UPI0022E3D32E|nr:uncharacterized protein LOC128258438 [Drosophila gunungcola]XP_052846001.1 uncharacterized protein LOC128258438 [Drosophila gunungcola]XP_052846002.1 uncharacterized protein LOC128258438 [Drosophila gunungcola]